MELWTKSSNKNTCFSTGIRDHPWVWWTLQEMKIEDIVEALKIFSTYLKKITLQIISLNRTCKYNKMFNTGNSIVPIKTDLHYCSKVKSYVLGWQRLFFLGWVTFKTNTVNKQKKKTNNFESNQSNLKIGSKIRTVCRCNILLNIYLRQPSTTKRTL